MQIYTRNSIKKTISLKDIFYRKSVVRASTKRTSQFNKENRFLFYLNFQKLDTH